MKSTTVKINVEGAYGLSFIGPKALCGREQKGGVSVAPLDHEGKREAFGVMRRQDVIDLHRFLGRCIAHWATEKK